MSAEKIIREGTDDINCLESKSDQLNCMHYCLVFITAAGDNIIIT